MHEARIASKDQYVIKGINAQTEVVKHSADYWKELATFAVHHGLVSSSDGADLQVACKLPVKIPNSVQSRHLLDLESRARTEGFKSTIE